MTETDRKYKYVKNLVKLTLAEVVKYQPPQNWMSIDIQTYISQFLVFDISVPRQYGKSRAMGALGDFLEFAGDDSIYIMDSRELSESLRGRTRPFGDNVKILIFEETFDSRHIKAIAENWLILGYNTYPKIIVLRTKPYVEDYKLG